MNKIVIISHTITSLTSVALTGLVALTAVNVMGGISTPSSSSSASSSETISSSSESSLSSSASTSFSSSESTSEVSSSESSLSSFDSSSSESSSEGLPELDDANLDVLNAIANMSDPELVSLHFGLSVEGNFKQFNRYELGYNPNNYGGSSNQVIGRGSIEGWVNNLWSETPEFHRVSQSDYAVFLFKSYDEDNIQVDGYTDAETNLFQEEFYRNGKMIVKQGSDTSLTSYYHEDMLANQVQNHLGLNFLGNPLDENFTPIDAEAALAPFTSLVVSFPETNITTLSETQFEVEYKATKDNYLTFFSNMVHYQEQMAIDGGYEYDAEAALEAMIDQFVYFNLLQVVLVINTQTNLIESFDVTVDFQTTTTSINQWTEDRDGDTVFETYEEHFIMDQTFDLNVVAFYESSTELATIDFPVDFDAFVAGEVTSF